MSELTNKTIEQAYTTNASEEQAQRGATRPAPNSPGGFGGGPSLLDAVLEASPTSRDWFAEFIEEEDWVKALRLWLHRRGGALPSKVDRRTVGALLDSDIAQLDQLLTDQVNAILHHPRFQKLESSWRGLEYLVDEAAQDDDAAVVTRVLNITWKELERDADRAVDFDRTQIWQKIYEEEYGTAGGQPFSVLVGDYEVRHRPMAADPKNNQPAHEHDDINVLRSIGQTAAASFAPFLTGAHPSLLGLNNFGQLERPIDVERVFGQAEYTAWNALRKEPDMKFVGITAPRTLMRLPYKAAYANVEVPICSSCGKQLPRRSKIDAPCPLCDGPVIAEDEHDPKYKALGFRFKEEVGAGDQSGYLWGNAAYALAGVLIRAFTDCRWLADIRGFDRNQTGAGVVPDLPSHSFGHDRLGVAPKMGTDVAIDDAQEKALADHGLIPLSHCHDTDWHVFYSNNSLHQPAVYNDHATTLNAKISSMLQYTFCASRFAHYLKVQMREKISSMNEAVELKDQLNNWVNGYVTQDSLASASIKAQFPLREANVDVVETPGRPGVYQCVMQLWPHYQLDEVSINVKMITPMNKRPR